MNFFQPETGGFSLKKRVMAYCARTAIFCQEARVLFSICQ